MIKSHVMLSLSLYIYIYLDICRMFSCVWQYYFFKCFVSMFFFLEMEHFLTTTPKNVSFKALKCLEISQIVIIVLQHYYYNTCVMILDCTYEDVIAKYRFEDDS